MLRRASEQASERASKLTTKCCLFAFSFYLAPRYPNRWKNHLVIIPRKCHRLTHADAIYLSSLAMDGWYGYCAPNEAMHEEGNSYHGVNWTTERERERMRERTKFDTNPYAPNGNNIHSEPASIRRLENNVCARAIVLLYVYVFTHKRLIEWRYSTAMNVTRRTLLVMLHARAIDYTFSSLSIAREMCVLYIHYTTFVHFVENQRNSLPFDGRSVYSMWTHTYLFFFLNGKITWTEYAVRLDFIWFLCW